MRRASRLLGLGLIAYGLCGIVILATLALGFWRALDTVTALSAAVEHERAALTDGLDRASATLGSTANTVGGVDASLTQAKEAVSSAATLSNDVSATMAQLAVALNVDFLGTQPFAGVSGGFTQASAELGTLAGQLNQTAGALEVNATDAQAVGTDLARLQVAIDNIRAGLEAAPDTAITSTDISTLRLAIGALVAWLGTQAAAAVLIGLWLLGRRLRSTRTP